MWRLLLAALLLLPDAAAARMKAGPVVMSPHVRMWAGGGGGGGPPLDSITNAIAAYGFRKLSTSYAGQAIRLRRASDSAQQDIGFTAGGDFDLAAATSFCNATSCFAAKWYDQSGVVTDMVQASAALQPPVVFSCLGAAPCLQLTTTTHQMAGPSVAQATGIVSFNTVYDRAVGTGICLALAISNNQIKTRSATAGIQVNGSVGTITSNAADAAWHSANGVINGAPSFLSVDGTVTTGSITGSTTAALPSITGAASTTCNLLEVIAWMNFAMTQSQAAALAAQQKAYWGF